MADMNFPDDLIKLERSAWAAIQDGTLTVDQALAVQQRITEFATETGQPRIDVEMALKRHVRHAEPDDEA